MLQGRINRPLGDLFGLANFGVNLTTLKPGSVSALRHGHSKQDEFIYIVSRHPTLQTDGGDRPLAPGMYAGFKAGSGDAHRLVNATDEEVVNLEICDRTPGDEVVYLHDDIAVRLVDSPAGKSRAFFHKNGAPH